MRGYLVNWSVRARVISWVDSLQLTTWKFLLALHLFSACFLCFRQGSFHGTFLDKMPNVWNLPDGNCVGISLSQWTRSYFGGVFSICRNFHSFTPQLSRILKLHHRTWPKKCLRIPGDFPSNSHPIPDDLVHNWATSGHWVAHHESTLLESVPKQLGFVTIFEDVMTWWPGAQHQRLCKGGFSNLHGDSKSQHLSWLLTVPSCSPEAAVSPATLVWYPWQLREHGLWWSSS